MVGAGVNKANISGIDIGDDQSLSMEDMGDGLASNTGEERKDHQVNYIEAL